MVAIIIWAIVGLVAGFILGMFAGYAFAIWGAIENIKHGRMTWKGRNEK